MTRKTFLTALLISLGAVLTISCNTQTPMDMEQSQTRQSQSAYVIGIISAIEPVVIQNKAKGMPSRTEARITITPTEAFDAYGKEIPAANYDDPVFAGAEDLAKQYKIGDKVKIVCTSQTGRHIQSIEKVD
jgi:hypothetical protein